MSYMRNVKVWGLAFSAMLLISGLAVANASAAPQWTLNGATIVKALAVTGTGTLEFTDTNGLVGPFTIHCTLTTTGTAGPGAADTTSTITVSSCTTVAGTCGSPSASPVNLPWRTELATIGGVVRDKITSDGKGAPGYTLLCTIGGLRVSDTCTSERGQPKVTLNTSPVPIEFDAGSGTLDCSIGGAGTGHIRGTILVKSSAGTLTASD
ncbi:MAG: hypothetical protein ACTHKT_10360 [Solirubrobacterales bacterium]